MIFIHQKHDYLNLSFSGLFLLVTPRIGMFGLVLKPKQPPDIFISVAEDRDSHDFEQKVIASNQNKELGVGSLRVIFLGFGLDSTSKKIDFGCFA